jgi:hypothetical protein
MRPVRLARIAAEAEGVRLRGMASRLAVRAVCLVIAMLFGIGTIVFVHVGAWGWIRLGEGMSYYATAGILGGIDLLIALILVVLATRSGPSRVEREALDVRNRAIEGVTSALTLSQLALPALRIVAGMRRRGRRA